MATEDRTHSCACAQVLPDSPTETHGLSDLPGLPSLTDAQMDAVAEMACEAFKPCLTLFKQLKSRPEPEWREVGAVGQALYEHGQAELAGILPLVVFGQEVEHA